MFICGFGNGGLKKLQGDGTTFTTVPLDINGVCAGSFDILMSKANKGKRDRFSKQALNTLEQLGMKPGLSIHRDENDNINHVS